MNGFQADDSLPQAGAAHAFDVPTTCGLTAYGPTMGVNYAQIGSSTQPVAGQNFLVELTNFTASGTALLFLSGSSAAIPNFGGTVLVDPFQLIPPGKSLPVPVAVGSGQLVLPLPASTGGLTLYAQAVKLDLSQPAWLALTHGLEIVICP